MQWVPITSLQLTTLKTDFGSMLSDFTHLKEKIETSNAEKILTIKYEPSAAKCQNCKLLMYEG